MKKIFLSLFILCIALKSVAGDKKEIEVAKAVETLRIAMIDGNGIVLEQIVSDKFSYGHSNGHVEDKKVFVEKLASGSSNFLSIDLTEQTITVSGNTAIVRHILTAKTFNKGTPADVHLKVMLVWQKTAGHWILLARQAVKID